MAERTRRGRVARVRGFFPAFVALAALSVVPACGGDAPGWLPLVRVIDGDTIVVRDAGRRVTVRIAGIDTPELHHPVCRPQYLAAEARDRLAEILAGGPVRLVPPGGGSSRDRYGRRLAYVETRDGTDAGAVLVREGLARVYRKFRVSRRERYLALEKEARGAGRGLWADGGLAEVRWLLRRGEPAIRVLPMTGWRYAVLVDGWVRAGVTGRGLGDALWAARRAQGARWNREHGRRDGEDPDEILRRANFRRVRDVEDEPAPSPREDRGRVRPSRRSSPAR